MSLQWMVRTENNELLGPFSKEEVQKMVTSRQISIESEVCESLGFWFPLSFQELLLERLGVEYPKNDGNSDEALQKTKMLTYEEQEAPTHPGLDPDSPEVLSTGVITFAQFKKAVKRSGSRVISPITGEPTRPVLQPKIEVLGSSQPSFMIRALRVGAKLILFGLVLGAVGYLLFVFRNELSDWVSRLGSR